MTLNTPQPAADVSSNSANYAVNDAMTPMMSFNIRQRDAEPGLGYVTKARFSHKILFQYMNAQKIMNHPRYQRGFGTKEGDAPDSGKWFDQLFKITEPKLNIETARANEMAVRWLRGDMMNRDLIWNARKTNEFPNAEVIQKDGLEIMNVYGPIVVPDSAHRHLGIHRVVQWSTDSSTIPATVNVDKTPVSKKEIESLLQSYDPVAHYANVTIYEVKPELEGTIFYQANDLTKPAGKGAAFDINRSVTPEIRFVDAIMKKSKIFEEGEIERRQTKIAEKSRKLATLSTLTAAAAVHNPRLVKYEANDKPKYEEAVAFAVDFFAEYANLFPAFQPGTSTADRIEFRKKSYAMQNILVHALFPLMFSLFDRATAKGDWRQDSEWRTLLARLKTKVEVQEETGNVKLGADGLPIKVEIMSRENTAWRSRIESKNEDLKTGKVTYQIQNTRATRKAAVDYLSAIISK